MRSEFAEQPSSFLPMRLASRNSGPLTDMTILVVEESRLSSETLRRLCISLGARHRRANSIASTMRHLGTYRPDVIIVDMSQRDGDGANLIRMLHEMKPRVHVVLGMSAQSDLRADALHAGANGFIFKPVDSVAVLQHAITSALPPHLQQNRPVLVSAERIVPDQGGLLEDLAHGLNLLSEVSDENCIGYAASFLVGVAAIAGDPELRDQAQDLAVKAANGLHGPEDAGRLGKLVSRRIEQMEASMPHPVLNTVSNPQLM